MENVYTQKILGLRANFDVSFFFDLQSKKVMLIREYFSNLNPYLSRKSCEINENVICETFLNYIRFWMI